MDTQGTGVLVSLAGQYGLPLVAVVAVWMAYQKLLKQVIDLSQSNQKELMELNRASQEVITKNAVAIEAMGRIIAANTASSERLASAIQSLDVSVARLQTHVEGCSDVRASFVSALKNHRTGGS
jgi:hypothetical protein